MLLDPLKSALTLNYTNDHGNKGLDILSFYIDVMQRRSRHELCCRRP